MSLSLASAIYSIPTLLWRLLGYSTSLGQASVGQVESLPPSPPSPPQVPGLGWFSRLPPPVLPASKPRSLLPSLPDSQPHLVFPGTAPFTIQTIGQHT